MIVSESFRGRGDAERYRVEEDHVGAPCAKHDHERHVAAGGVPVALDLVQLVEVCSGPHVAPAQGAHLGCVLVQHRLFELAQRHCLAAYPSRRAFRSCADVQGAA
jgi:hypothetical protein